MVFFWRQKCTIGARLDHQAQIGTTVPLTDVTQSQGKIATQLVTRMERATFGATTTTG